MSGLDAIRSVLGAYRSTEAHITQEQITAAWAEYEDARRFREALEEIAAWDAEDSPEDGFRMVITARAALSREASS